jgi:hypothetical protein
MKRVDLDWLSTRVKKGLSNGEGLIFHVRDARTDQREVKARAAGAPIEYESYLADHGVPDKRLLVVEHELATVLKRMGGETNTLSTVLREAWDSGTLSTLTRHSPLQATGAHVSVLGHITEAELRRYLTETDMANGFANRFLFLCVRRSSSCRPRPASRTCSSARSSKSSAGCSTSRGARVFSSGMTMRRRSGPRRTPPWPRSPSGSSAR